MKSEQGEQGERRPRLRFPEFEDTGGWNEKKLKDIADIVMGSSPPSEAFNTNSIGLPFMQGNADIRNGLSAPRLYTSEITKECKVDDILLSVRAPVGSIAKSIHHACIGRGLAAIRAIPSNSQEYLHQWLIQFEPNWKNISQGGTFEAINSNDVNALLVSLPRQVDEQTRIADCLSSLDSLIAAQTQKLDALRSHKRGLMQQLFPAEGESVPRLRFPEFEEAGEWEERRLGEVCENISSGKDKNDLSGSYPLFGSTGIIGKTTFQTYSGSFVLVARVGANAGQLNLVKGDFGATDNTLVIKSKNSLDIVYLFYHLSNLDLNGLVFGSGQPLITGGQLKSLTIPLPDELEQTRIADCLSSLDSLISAQSDKIAELKTFKRGLMQQLFPALDEGEG